MKAPFVRVRGVRPALGERFKATCRTRRKRIKATCLILFQRYVEKPERYDIPPRRMGRSRDEGEFILGTCPAAAWFAFRAVVVRRGEALPDVVEVLLAAYCRKPDRYDPPYVYRRRKPRRKPKGPVL